MDYDRDGDLDLVVSCSDVPYQGSYFFENPGDDPQMPIFKPTVHIGPGIRNITLSYPDGKPRMLTPNDLVILDHEGFLAFFQRERRAGKLILQPAERVFAGGVFDSGHKPRGNETNQLWLNNRTAGGSGRRKLCIVGHNPTKVRKVACRFAEVL